MVSPNVTTPPPDAYEELNSLIQTLHEQGLLCFVNRMIASHSEWMPALSEIVNDSKDFRRLRNAIPAVIEVASVLDTLHQQGFLRLVTTAAASWDQWAPALGDLFDETVDIEQWRSALPAFIEFAGLVRSLHEQGLLRFANNIVSSRTELMSMLSGVAEDYLSDDRTRRALENLAITFTMLLSRINPAQLSKILLAMGDSLEYIVKYKPEQNGRAAPGLMGVYRLVKDESLWHSLTPIIAAIKVFGKELGRRDGGNVPADVELRRGGVA